MGVKLYKRGEMKGERERVLWREVTRTQEELLKVVKAMTEIANDGTRLGKLVIQLIERVGELEGRIDKLERSARE